MDQPPESTTFQQLPRSIRWRLQLKLFEWPPDANPTGSTLMKQIQQQNATIIQQQNERFQKLVEQYIEEDVPEGEEETAPTVSHEETTAPTASAEIDPLTAMFMEKQAQETRQAELLLKYKKERARRKRGLNTEGGRQIGDEMDGIDRASLVIIEKDLKRLPHPTSNNGAASGNLTSKEEERINHLKEILYIYAQEHSTMGYRQGMHEVASYLLYALELEHPQYPDNPQYTSILATCFVMLERVLEQLELAYDASGEQSLQRLSQSILSKVRQNDPGLFHMLTTSPNIPPPPIYCTRWVRLLFSREVVGFENVFALWDIFFQYHPQIMRVLEMASVARILLLSRALIDLNHSPLDLLMNIPQHADIVTLANLTKQLMAQKDTDPPIAIPESQMINVPPSQSGAVVASPPTVPPIPSPQSLRMLSPLAAIGQSNSADSPLAQSNGTNHGGSRAFSFSKMKDTLGKKSESLRQKIMTATNEWNWENSHGEPGQSNNHFCIPSTDIFTAAGEVLRQGSQWQNLGPGGVATSDPSRNPGVMPEPPSPQKHQHARWSHGMKERILILQNYLMTIESSSPHEEKADNGTGEEQRKVPTEVWEAMADLQRMQQELHNYSLHMT